MNVSEFATDYEVLRPDLAPIAIALRAVAFFHEADRLGIEVNPSTLEELQRSIDQRDCHTSEQLEATTEAIADINSRMESVEHVDPGELWEACQRMVRFLLRINQEQIELREKQDKRRPFPTNTE